MPKRKTADVNVEQVPAPEPKKRSSASKPKTAVAPVHSRTHRKAKTEASTAVAVPHVETVVESPSAVAPSTPTHDEIARLAYLRAEARGFRGGSPDEDWLAAERELLELAQNR